MNQLAPWLLLALAPASFAQALHDTPENDDQLGSALARGDFNGDGFADLAIGVPGESVKVHAFPPLGVNHLRAGAVHVLYGRAADGLEAHDSRFLTQLPASTGVPGIGAGHAFGSSLARGDFNGDGFDDLAIGIPGQKLGSLPAAGAVQVVFGSPNGLDLHTAVVLTQDSPWIADVAEAKDLFGSSVAAGDFDGDGYDELAIGAPGEDLQQAWNAGVVHVLRGTYAGLSTKKSSIWAQGMPLLDLAEQDDALGTTLAAGDLNGDGAEELVIGVPQESIAQLQDGALHVVFGSPLGLTPAGNQLWHQDVAGIEGECEQLDGFATALSVADYTGDGFGDIAVGIPEEVTGSIRGGAVQLLIGSASGPSAATDVLFTQDTGIVIEELEPGDRFGAQLTPWFMNGLENAPMLAIGVPGESILGVPQAGALEVVGFDASGQIGYSFFTSAEFTWAFGPLESGNGVGLSLAAGDFNGDGHDDIAVGSPYLDIDLAVRAGQVGVIYPTIFVPDTWHQ